MGEGAVPVVLGWLPHDSLALGSLAAGVDPCVESTKLKWFVAGSEFGMVWCWVRIWNCLLVGQNLEWFVGGSEFGNGLLVGQNLELFVGAPTNYSKF